MSEAVRNNEWKANEKIPQCNLRWPIPPSLDSLERSLLRPFMKTQHRQNKLCRQSVMQ